VDRTASVLNDSGEGPRWRRLAALAEPILKELGRAPVRLVSVPGASGTVATEGVPAADALARGADLWRPVLAAEDVGLTVAWLAAQDPDRPVIVATDVPPAAGLPGHVYVLATGGTSRNVGLVRAATRVEGNQWWLLVTARSGEGAGGPCGIEVTNGAGEPLAREPALVRSGQTVERVIPMPGAPGARVRVSLTGEGGRTPVGDGFPADDTACLAWQSGGPLRVLLSGQPDEALERAVAAREDTVALRSAAASDVQAGDADVVVAVSAAVPPGWKGPAALVAPPADAGPVAPLAEQAPSEWTVATAHPLAEALYLEPPRVGPVRRYRMEPGADLLLGTRDVPLAVTWQADGSRRLAVLFPFDLETTDWPRRAGFPVFWRRALDWLVPREGGSGGHATVRPFETSAKEPGFRSAEGGAEVGVSFIGTDEGFQAGPARDDSQAALRAVRQAMAGRRAESLNEVWPWLALAAVAALVLRSWVAR